MATRTAPSRAAFSFWKNFVAALLTLCLLAAINLPLAFHWLSALALTSIFVSALLWLRTGSRSTCLASFLPAIPIACSAAYSLQNIASAKLLVAVALAFEWRRWLLQFSDSFEVQRTLLAEKIQALQGGNATVYVDNDIESQISADRVQEGHLLRLSPGQVCPADGIVTYGSSFVDESLLPEQEEDISVKGTGSRLLAGSRIKNGNLLLKVNATGSKTFASRLAARISQGQENSAVAILAIDAAFTLVSALLLAFSGPESAAFAFFASSGATSLAALSKFEWGLAEFSARARSFWNPGGLRRLLNSGTLVAPSRGVIQSERFKIVAIESIGKFSEAAVLGLLGPLARKIETPEAFALLQEMRMRNIPLQQSEYFQPETGLGGFAIVGGEEVRWIQLSPGQPAHAKPGELSAFVEEHQSAGDEICLLELRGQVRAGVAFRDQWIPGAEEAVTTLNLIGLPLILAAGQSRRFVARLQTELGLTHAQGECSPADLSLLFERLQQEKLRPAWVQVSPFRPRTSWAAVAAPAVESAELTLADPTLPRLASTMYAGRLALARIRLAIGFVLSWQTGLLLTLLAANFNLVPWSSISQQHGTVNPFALAVLGLVPAFPAVLLAFPRFAPRTKAAQNKEAGNR